MWNLWNIKKYHICCSFTPKGLLIHDKKKLGWFEVFCSLQMYVVLYSSPCYTLDVDKFITQSRFLGDGITLLCFVSLFFVFTEIVRLTVLQIHGSFVTLQLFQRAAAWARFWQPTIYSNSYYWCSILTECISRSKVLKRNTSHKHFYVYSYIDMYDYDPVFSFFQLSGMSWYKGIESNGFELLFLKHRG